MKGVLSTLILISFTGIAVFGLWGMNTGGHRSHSNSFASCLGSLSQGTSCPINPTESVNFHLNSFKEFSSSPVPQSSGNLIIFSLMLSLVLASVLIAKKFQIPAVVLSPNREHLLKSFETYLHPFKRERISWNLLHENSPNLF